MEKSTSSVEEIGQRLRMLRSIVGLKRVELAKLAGVSKASISVWEHGKVSTPIKPKSLDKLLAAFNNLGLTLTDKWVLFGTGEAPYYKGFLIGNESNNLSIKNEAAQEKESLDEDISTQLATNLSEEIKLFTTIKKAVIIKIDHGLFEPFISNGDMIGGIWENALCFHKGKLCIIQLEDRLQAIFVENGSQKGCFNLRYPKINNIDFPEIKDKPLEKIAPVIRIWR